MRFTIATVLLAQLVSVPAFADRTPAQATRATAPAAAAKNRASGTDADGVQPFLAAVNDYMALRKKVDDAVPALTETNNPAKIAARERALGEAMIKARANAKPGDVFVKPFIPVLKRMVDADFAKRTAAERKALVVELPKGVAIKINSIYPTTVPLATFPARLLTQLPELPQELEYRMVNRSLILRDVRANYVVDLVPDVFPIPMERGR